MLTPEETIVRRRRLAFNSDERVRVGERVRPDTVIAVTMLPLPRLFFLSAFRALPRGLLEGYIAEWLAEEGDFVDLDVPIVEFTPIETAPGEIIAPGGIRAQAPDKLVFRSPLAGVIENLNEETGLVMLREEIDYDQRRAVVQAGTRLKVRGRKLKRYLKHQVGDFVEKGQMLAQRVDFGDTSSPGGFTFARAPIAGIITDIDLGKGLIRLEREFREVELHAGFFGTVSSMDNEAITITAKGRRVQGICGIGGDAHGRLRVAVRRPDEELGEGRITSHDRGMILVGGSRVTLEALRAAAELEVAGIITGGADHIDLCEFLGQDFAVAITGKEIAPFPVVITNEFGTAPMDGELFDFFKKFERSWTHVNSTTHMRAGVVRPEIVVMSADSGP